MNTPPKPRAHVRPIFMVLVVIGCAVITWAFLLPGLRGGGPSTAMRIVSNLKQIEAAKQIWAENHNATNSTHVPEEALALCFPQRLKPGELVPPAAGERYIFNAVGVAPEAQLTRSLGKWPAGTIIRLHATTNRAYEIILPDDQGGASGRKPLGSETNQAPSADGSGR